MYNKLKLDARCTWLFIAIQCLVAWRIVMLGQVCIGLALFGLAGLSILMWCCCIMAGRADEQFGCK